MVEQFRSATGPNKIALPTNDSDLEEKWVVMCCLLYVFHLLLHHRLDIEEELIMRTYDETLVVSSLSVVLECFETVVL